MIRLLISEVARRRIAAGLDALGDRVQVLAIDEAGAIHGAQGLVALETAQPHVAWFTDDVLRGPAFDDFCSALLASTNLGWGQTVSAGVNNSIFKEMAARGARVTNSHGQALSIAEYVVTEVLVHYQHRAERVRAQAERRWQAVPFRELGLTHWLIVGFGAIGQAVAQRVRSFGARVTAVDQVARPLADRTVQLPEVCSVASEADVVVLALPLTDETAGVADERFFAAMKSDAVFVNVGRGGLVDEAALLAALDAGAPAHAVLDVVVTEPLPADSPLWDHPRVVLSAHTSALGSGYQARNDAAFLANLARFVDGQPLESEVDRKTLASPIVDWKAS